MLGVLFDGFPAFAMLRRPIFETRSIRTTNDRGILTVSVPLSDAYRLDKHIEVVEIVSIEDEDLDDDDENIDADAADQLVSADKG